MISDNIITYKNSKLSENVIYILTEMQKFQIKSNFCENKFLNSISLKVTPIMRAYAQ